MDNKITISGKACTGKTTLFNNLHKVLGWKTFSVGQFFRDFAKKKGVTIESAREQEEKITKKTDYGTTELLKEKEEVIIEGWMAGIMANDISDVLKVLLVCDDKIRFKRFAKRENIDFSEAREKITKRENNLFIKLESIYHRSDFTDAKNYNLVINTSNLSPEEILDKVLHKLQDK